MQKHRGEATQRLKLYNAAIDTLRNSTISPETHINSQQSDVYLHRFYGQTKEGVKFCVQVKEDRRSGRKDFISVFSKKA